jgi:hypothetical protein
MMESDLEVATEDSIKQLSLTVPNPRLNVVILGDKTRIASKLLGQPAPPKATDSHFVVYQ